MQNTLTRYENATFNFSTSFQWNRNGETGTQLPKLLSLHLRTSLWFYQTSYSGTFCFTLGWMKNAFQTTCSSHFETKWLNYEDNLCRVTIHTHTHTHTHTKKFQNLQRLLSRTLMSTEKPRFCRFEEKNWIFFSFLWTSMPIVISVSQNLHHLIRFNQRYPSFVVLPSIVKCSLLRFQFSEM